ncbi:unnamed protein product [Prunus brigantina]
MFQLRHDIVQVLCKFEMIFPSAFFTSMMHVMVHLPEEALLAGPVNYRWMYPIERLLGELKKSVRNRVKPEGSIVEAWVQYESLTFCGMYLKDVETIFNRPQCNYDEGMRNEKLSHEEMMKREHPSHLVAQKHRELFPQWFLDSMSDLIRRRRAVTTTLGSEPPAQPVSAATAPALMEQDHVLADLRRHTPASSSSSAVQPVSTRRWHRPTSTTDITSTDGTGASGAPPAKRNTRGPCRQLKTVKVTQVTNSRISIGYDEHHRVASTVELHSSLAHDIGHVVRTHCPMQWKSWKVMPDEIKMQVCGQLSTNYHLEDLNEESMTYVNRLFGERYKQCKSDLHHHFEAFDDPQVALQEGCPKELEGREDSWAWLCAHFQAPDYVNKAQVNKGNRKKKTLLHHFGSRPFSYRMDARRRGGSKFPEINVFGDVYVRPGNELAESLHVKEPVGSSRVYLQTSSRDSDRVCGSSAGCWISDFDADANSQVTVLTSRVAELEGQMSGILQSLARSGIPIPNFGAPTSEPVHPEHPQQTTAPADAQTSEPHVADDQVDFGTLFD